MARAALARQDRDVPFRRELPTSNQVKGVIELLSGLGRILMAIDAKLDQIVDLLEEDS
jgi:hypothetical protein